MQHENFVLLSLGLCAGFVWFVPPIGGMLNSVDTLGRTVYKYVNANGNYNYNSGFNYFINIEKPDTNVNAGLDFNKSNYSNVVNDKKV